MYFLFLSPAQRTKERKISLFPFQTEKQQIKQILVQKNKYINISHAEIEQFFKEYSLMILIFETTSNKRVELEIIP